MSEPLASWPLLPVPDPQGHLRYPTLEESVRQSIRIILLTRPGERLMRPGFGAGLEEFLQQENDIATRRRIRERIREALLRWEPRLLLDGVDVRAAEDRPETVVIEISYRLRRDNRPGRVGISMELQGTSHADKTATTG